MTGPVSPSGQGPVGPTPPPADANDPILNSPFAKMFTTAGFVPTAKDLHMIINNILKQELDEIKKSDERWKEAMQKLRKASEGDDDD